jgi:outer membrane lipoprotein SlyB
MLNRFNAALTTLMLGSLAFATAAVGSTVQFGRITAVRQVEICNADARAAGALVGGTLGMISGSGQSRSNRALRSVGGAAVGSRVGGAAGSSTGFEYTVLIGARTVQLVTDQGGLRIGDCVSIERGAFNNIRLEADERCDRPDAGASDAALTRAYACDSAKRQLLEAESDEDFQLAERRMRLLCD